MREKLIELLAEHCAFKEKRCVGCDEGKYYRPECKTNLFGKIADHLIANGVTVQGWIPVSVQKPEENKGVKVYDDGHMSLISVLVCGGNRGVNIANRFQIRPVGIPYLDEHATDGWEWSVGNEDITHWMPLPQPAKGE